eukprot:2996007-Amphidinium_carterae.1
MLDQVKYLSCSSSCDFRRVGAFVLHLANLPHVFEIPTLRELAEPTIQELTAAHANSHPQQLQGFVKGALLTQENVCKLPITSLSKEHLRKLI